jgi:hypothetical protein
MTTATVRQIDDMTWESSDGRYRIWMGHPSQVFIREPLPQYTYRRTMGGETILQPQYDRQLACYRTPEGEAYIDEIADVLCAVLDAHDAQQEANRSVEMPAVQEWRSPRGLTLTEEMDREDSDY